MSFDRAFFALVFVSALLVFTAVWGSVDLTIDPNSRTAPSAAPAQGGAVPLDDHGLMIDPNG